MPGGRLTRHLAAAGVEVVEVNRPTRRRRGKTDTVDAETAARAALCGASPIEASSGPTVRHRLNRGGNR